MICVSRSPDPPNVYLAAGSISGNTFVNDAAASTVGREPVAVGVELLPARVELVELLAAGVELLVDGVDVLPAGVFDEWLLDEPQPTTTAAVATAVATAPNRMNPLRIGSSSRRCCCQDPGRVLGFWQ
jgi:hypothetical protein